MRKFLSGIFLLLAATIAAGQPTAFANSGEHDGDAGAGEHQSSHQ